MAGTYNSGGRGISWQQAWTLLHTARTDAERGAWEQLFFDGRDTPGNVNLLGQRATTRIPDIHKLGGKEVALTGQAATATAGTAIGQETFEFTVDSMTGTNGTAITSHTGELGATWTDVGAGTVATIQTNRLRPAADSTGVNMYTASGTPSDANYAVAADIYMIAWNGNAAWQYLDVGVMARYSATNGGECYAFGWDAYFGGWALYKLYAGSWSMISINQSYDSTRAAGDARTIELFVEGTTNPRLRGWVNGVLVQEYTDTYQQITSTGVAGVVMCNQEINFVIDRVVFDNTVPAKEQLFGHAAEVRQYRFLDLYDNTTYPNDLFVNDTFTDTDGQWLYSHTGETGATWSIIEDSATWPAFITSNKVQTPNDTGITKWQASGTPGLFGANYAVQADLYAPTTNYSFNGIGARWAFDTVMRGYALCLTREWSSGVMYWQLRQYDNGYTDLGQSYEFVPAAGTSAQARLEVSGTGSHVFLRAYVNGRLIMTVIDRSTSRVTNAYQAGLAYQLASANWDVLDNFKAGWPTVEPAGTGVLYGLGATTVGGTFNFADRSASLTGQAATTARGSLGLDVGATLLGRSATTAQGALGAQAGGNIEQALTGLPATTARGTMGVVVDASVVLTGRSATTAAGAVGRGWEGQRATTTQGVLAPEVGAGFVAAGEIAPTVSYTYTASPTWPGYTRNHFLPVDGYFVGMGEVYDLSGNDARYRAGQYKVSYEAQTAWPWDKDGYPLYYTVDALDINFNWSTYTSGLNFPRGGTRAGDQSDWNYDSAPSAEGGFFSVSPDGDVQSTVVRTRINLLGNFPYLDYSKSHLKSADTYFTWQQGDPQINGQQYSGPEFRRGVTDAHSDRFTAPLGLYAVGSNRSLLFYAQPHDVSVAGVQVQLSGLEATVRGQYGLTPSHVGDGSTSALVGQRATTGYGTLPNDITWPSWSATVELTGKRLEARWDPLDGNSGNDYVVPALSALTYVNSDSRWGAESRLVPATQTFAIDKYLTVAHSGYGDTIYVVYLSGTHAAPTTPAYVGVVVMDAVTRTVHSHTLTALATKVANWRNGWYVGNASNILPHRSVAHVHKLSSGTSLTQFQIGGYVVKLSWTAGTVTSPTITPKDYPTTPVNYSWFIGGWETVEVKGDRVYHVLYEVDAYMYNRLRYHYNDVTANDSTWTRHVPAVDLGTMGDYAAAYSGFGVPNRKSWLFIENITYSIGGPSNSSALTYWLNWWSAEQPLLSVESAGKLGRLVVVIEDINKTVALGGLAATTAQGVIEEFVHMRLDGRAATATGGLLTPLIYLTGQAATTAQGALQAGNIELTGRTATTAAGVLAPQLLYGLTATATAGTLVGVEGTFIQLTGRSATTGAGYLGVAGLPTTTVPLTGLSAATAKGYVWFGGAQLEGRAATLQWGFLEVSSSENETLTGSGLISARGTLTPNVSASPLGRNAATAAGALTLVVAVPYWKLLSQATASAGVLTPSTVTTIQLTGRAATAAGGTLTPLSEKSNAATGYVATAVSGALSVSMVVSLLGQRAVSAAGAVVPLVAVTPEGRSAVCAQGVLQLLTNIFLTGRSGTCAIGSVGYTYDSTAILSGVYSKGEVGDAAQGLWKPRSEHLLWVFTEPEEPEAAADDEREYVLVAPRG